MAISVVARFPELSAEMYDQVIASLDLDANPPAGAILHVAGEADGSMTTSEIWQTEQTFQALSPTHSTIAPSAPTHRAYSSRSCPPRRPAIGVWASPEADHPTKATAARTSCRQRP